MRRSLAGQLWVAFAIVSLASACGVWGVNLATVPEGDHEFAPILAPAPADISPRLVIDSTVAVAASSGEQPRVGASAGSCPYALRDPRTGTGYMLAASVSVETRIDATPSRSVVTSDAQANYLPSGDYRLPGDHYLRVSCRSLQVLGLAAEI